MGEAQKLKNNSAYRNSSEGKDGTAIDGMNITSLYSEGALAHGQLHKREMIDIHSIIGFQKGSWQ